MLTTLILGSVCVMTLRSLSKAMRECQQTLDRFAEESK